MRLRTKKHGAQAYGSRLLLLAMLSLLLVMGCGSATPTFR